MKKLISWFRRNPIRPTPTPSQNMARLEDFKRRGCVLDKYDMKQGG